MPSLTRDIPHGSDLAQRILQECKYRMLKSEREIQVKYKKWRDAEEKALAYLPERDVDRARRETREDTGLPQYTTIQIPYSYAVLMSAHTYITSVFMARNPVMQFGARHGEPAQNVQAVEALIDYQLLNGRILVPLYIWLYDYLKYGVGCVGCYWEDRVESIASIDWEDGFDEMGNPVKTDKKVESRMFGKTYSGNKVYNIQPWDFLWDVRFPMWKFQEGEYLGLRYALTWNECKRRAFSGYYMDSVLEMLPVGGSGDRIATGAVSSNLVRPETTDNSQHQEEFRSYQSNMKHPHMVRGYEVFVEVIPEEWGLSKSIYPEKWVFTCTSDFKYLIGAQPLGAWHCKFPASILSLEPEGYGLTTRGMPEILEPVQNTVDWLLNTHFYNIRAALNDKMIVDPSRVVMKDVLDPLPGGIIRLKPQAYGTNVQEAMSQLRVTDVTQQHINDLPMMIGIGERISGVNDQIMGMQNTGGRKTATEVRSSTTFGVNRLKTISEFASVSGFDPLAQMLVSNSQQYYDGETKFKIAGDLISTASPSFMLVNPQMIMGSFDYVPVDGTLPIDRYAQVNLWLQMFGQIRQFPALLMQYDLAKLFAWVAQLAGLKNIEQFKIQLAPDEQLQLQAQQGNVVPMKGGNQPTPSTATSPEPGQVPGMGATG